MARQIAIIQQQLLDNITADTTLSPLLTSTSKRSIYRLFTYIIAVAVNTLEQLIDSFTVTLEAVAYSAAPSTPAWVQAQILLFQYSATVPQVIQLLNFAPAYPVVDATLRIISRCSVTTNLSNSVVIKVATLTPPAALSAGQLSSLQSYVNQIAIAGINYNVTSTNSDKIYIQASIYYQGQYSNVIVLNVQNAINNFLALLPFNGVMKISDLEGAIRTVTGVNDVIFINVQTRSDATAYGSGTYLIQNNQVIARLWNTISGYMVPETTAGQTLTQSLNFIAE
jgi:hypothetical protein